MDSDNLELDSIKAKLKSFFVKAQINTISKNIDRDILYFNKDIFELERCLLELKAEYGLNKKLDARLYSEHILNSFSSNSKAFNSQNYSLAFLVYLCHQQNHDAEYLLEMINDFIDSVKDNLSFHDITVTKSGATRCVTNVRFALKQLRKIGLVYNETIIKDISRRTVLPTPLGYLVSFYVLNSINLKASHYLSLNNSTWGYNRPLFEAINKMRYSMDDFLQDIKKRYPTLKKLNKVSRDLLIEYLDHLLPYIELTDTKLIIDESGLDKAMKEYYIRLSKHVELAYQLKDIFLKSFVQPLL